MRHTHLAVVALVGAVLGGGSALALEPCGWHALAPVLTPTHVQEGADVYAQRGGSVWTTDAGAELSLSFSGARLLDDTSALPAVYPTCSAEARQLSLRLTDPFTGVVGERVFEVQP